jgi:hypothetical protein
VVFGSTNFGELIDSIVRYAVAMVARELLVKSKGINLKQLLLDCRGLFALAQFATQQNRLRPFVFAAAAPAFQVHCFCTVRSHHQWCELRGRLSSRGN